MWTRKELKENAKKCFSANYWKSVLAALILLVVLGGCNSNNNSRWNINEHDMDDVVSINLFNNGVDETKEDIREAADDLKEAFAEFDNSKEVQDAIDTLADSLTGNFNKVDIAAGVTSLVVTIIVIVIVVVLIACLLGAAFSAFLLNPLEVGGRKFFLENHDAPASVGCYGHSFKTNYLNVVLTMFLKDLYTFLWALLFIIPGIIKAYEYRMIPYILAENPDIDHSEAFERSKEMMSGNKWAAFVLDLSFIGWHLLNFITFGLLGVFFVNPYVYQTEAELYVKLCEVKSEPEKTQDVQYDNYIEVE